MPRATKRLGVWLDGGHVADLEQVRWPQIRLRYLDSALARWPQNSPVISCSLPLGADPHDALAFCKGLLPEGQALQQMAAQAGVAVNETFGLLERYGRDVAGALVIGAQPPDASRFDAIAYSDETLAEAIDELGEHPLGTHEDSELSLAGLQDKLLLVKLGDGSWARPIHGRPSTHILKVDDPRHPGLVKAEALCLALARDAALTTVDTELAEIADGDQLIVSRFDRTIGPRGEVRRVHQEDVCQALAIDPDGNRGQAKYERAGGPSLLAIARLLDQYGQDPLAELDQLIRVVTFTCLIGNADAHGKNLAYLHPTPGTIALAPLYDTVPTLLWPRLRKESAMRIGGRVLITETTVEDIVREAQSWGLPRDRAATIAAALIDRCLNALEHGVIPPHSDVAALVRERAAAMAPFTQQRA